MAEIFSNWGLQVLSIVGVISVFGLIVGFLCRIFYSGAGRAGHGLCVATGLIGTPIHELGHALFCLLFGHKIVEMRLFQPNSEDGVLGYVNHSYNPRNVYHQIGNFFIGVGPIVFGSGALIALMALLIPDTLTVVSSSVFVEGGSLESVMDAFGSLFTGIFSSENFSTWQFWVFLVLACLITLHMTLSPADIKGSIVGVVYIVVLLLLANVALYYLSYESMIAMTNLLLGVGVTIACFLAIAAIFSALMAVIGIVLHIVIK